MADNCGDCGVTCTIIINIVDRLRRLSEIRHDLSSPPPVLEINNRLSRLNEALESLDSEAIEAETAATLVTNLSNDFVRLSTMNSAGEFDYERVRKVSLEVGLVLQSLLKIQPSSTGISPEIGEEVTASVARLIQEFFLTT